MYWRQSIKISLTENKREQISALRDILLSQASILLGTGITGMPERDYYNLLHCLKLSGLTSKCHGRALELFEEVGSDAALLGFLQIGVAALPQQELSLGCPQIAYQSHDMKGTS